MKSTRLMVVLAMSLGCAATRLLQPSVAAESKLVEPSMPAGAFYSDPGTPIAGQRYCWMYYFSFELNRIRTLAGWQECEGRKPLVWERHDRKTNRWLPERAAP
jgi:hypothetical protein